MSLSSLLAKIGLSTATLCVVVALSGMASAAPSDDGGTGSPPPPTSTTAVSPDDGNPWHG